MSKDETERDARSELRRRAMAALHQQGTSLDVASSDLLRQTLHELQIHQVELEVQAEELRRAQQEIEQSRDRYFELYDMAPVGYFTLDQQGILLQANLTAADLLGVARADLLHQPLSRFVHAQAQDEYYFYLKHMQATGRGQPCELDMVKQDGARFNGRLSCMVVAATDGSQQLRVVLTDTTAQVEAEQDRQKTQRLEAIGMLAGGIAHDFNNLFTAILGNISLVTAVADLDAGLLSPLASAEKAVRQAQSLANQLLTFARGGAPIKRTVHLAGLMREAAAFSTSGSRIRCEFVLPADLWPVDADVGQLNQVFGNLLVNADQAMPGGGVVVLKAENVRRQAGQWAALPAGRYVQITIIDQGTGIDPQHLPMVFDPYFTTKPQHSGLGLAVVFSIIKRHGGEIKVLSRPGAGTSFYMVLPASDKRVAEAADAPAGIVTGSGRVLVMDDQDLVSEIAANLLARAGYEVETVCDGLQAIAACESARAAGHPFDVVILDLTVPGGMGGEEAASHLRTLDPTMKLIVSSGYSNDPIMADFRLYGFDGVLSKPYNLHELTLKVSQMLHPSHEAQD